MKYDLVIALEFGQSRRFAKIISVHVCDRNFQHLTGRGCAGKRRVGPFPSYMHLTAQKSQSLVTHHRAGKQTGFQQDLKSIADTQHQTTGTSKPVHGFHHRRKTRDRAGAQVVSEREAARQDNGIAPSEVFGLVPDKVDGLADDRAYRLTGVVIAIRTGKLYHSEFHWPVSPLELF